MCDFKNSVGGRGWDASTACREYPCTALRGYWRKVPMSSHSDGASGVIDLFPFLFHIYGNMIFGKSTGKRWDIEHLYTIQQKRVTELLNAMASGSISGVADGHYHCIDELYDEIHAHVKALQEWARLKQKAC
jgi:hypothetical protein